ncbi:MAG: hypothetical protein ACRDG7_18840 [Candidatus Limnocylindria bacterium]
MQLAAAAARAGLPLELGVSLLVQQRLIQDALGALVPTRLSELLDQTASKSSIQLPLSSVSVAYLRDLQARQTLSPAELTDPTLIPIPFRLIDQMLAHKNEPVLDPASLERARAWEMASVVRGQTMAEWAGLVVAAALGEEVR